jgi:hypothetical protein
MGTMNTDLLLLCSSSHCSSSAPLLFETKQQNKVIRAVATAAANVVYTCHLTWPDLIWPFVHVHAPCLLTIHTCNTWSKDFEKTFNDVTSKPSGTQSRLRGRPSATGSCHIIVTNVLTDWLTDWLTDLLTYWLTKTVIADLDVSSLPILKPAIKHET